MQLPIKALALALLAGAAGAARAGFTTSAWLDASYDATQPLADGTVYFVTNSVTFEGAYDGRSGLAVAPGAEVVIYVRENCTLRANGTNAVQGGPGGGAGILCPAGSTLVVTGPGAVRAVGGNASDGEVRGRAIGGCGIMTADFIRFPLFCFGSVLLYLSHK